MKVQCGVVVAEVWARRVGWRSLRHNPDRPTATGRPERLSPDHLIGAFTYICSQLIRADKPIPECPPRQAPHARKRGGSHRHRRCGHHEPAVRTVTHCIELHPLPPHTELITLAT
jgi:hypothetical protein